MNRRTFMMGLFGVAGTAVCAGKVIAGDAVSVPFRAESNYTPVEFRNFPPSQLNETLKNIEEERKRLNEKIQNMKPGDVLGMGDAR